MLLSGVWWAEKSQAQTFSGVALNQQYEALQDTSRLPVHLRRLSAAVIRLAKGTGFFVRYGGEVYVITNNHVVGMNHCARSGCYVDAVMDFERDHTPQSLELFLQPVAARVDLDIAIYRFWQVNNRRQRVVLQPPAVLEFADARRGMKGLQNVRSQRVYVVGHPRGGIKKFSVGRMTMHRYGYMMVDAFSLPGSSGSPILRADGRVVGVHHSSHKRNDMFTHRRIVYEGRGTKTQEILKLLRKSNAQKKHALRYFIDVKKPVTFRQAQDHATIFQWARTIPRVRTGQDYFAMLYQDCAQKLDLRTEHITRYKQSHQSCTIAYSWFACHHTHGLEVYGKPKLRHGVQQVSSSLIGLRGPLWQQKPSLGYCPHSVKVRQQWRQLFMKVGQGYQKFVGEDPWPWLVGGPARVTTTTDHVTPYRRYLRQQQHKMQHLQPSAVFAQLHEWLQASTLCIQFQQECRQHLKYEHILRYIKNYQRFPGYEYYIPLMARVVVNLYRAQLISEQMWHETIETLRQETSLSLYAKLSLEKIQYEHLMHSSYRGSQAAFVEGRG